MQIVVPGAVGAVRTDAVEGEVVKRPDGVVVVVAVAADKERVPLGSHETQCFASESDGRWPRSAGRGVAAAVPAKRRSTAGLLGMDSEGAVTAARFVDLIVNHARRATEPTRYRGTSANSGTGHPPWRFREWCASAYT